MSHLQRAAFADRRHQRRSPPEMLSCINIVPKRFCKCTFCKRHFASMKALGSHQNVHRHYLLQAADDEVNGPQEVDLELRLSCGPPPPPPTPNNEPFYEFLPLKKEGEGLYGYGYTYSYNGLTLKL